MSHMSVLRLIDNVGKGHDNAVEKWRDGIKSELKIPETELVLIIVIIITFIIITIMNTQSIPRVCLSNALSDDGDSESDSDSSSDTSSLSSRGSDSAESVLSFNGPSITSMSSSDSDSSDNDNDRGTNDPSAQQTLPTGNEEQSANLSDPKMYRFNGDNMDYTEVSRYQRSDAGNKS